MTIQHLIQTFNGPVNLANLLNVSYNRVYAVTQSEKVPEAWIKILKSKIDDEIERVEKEHQTQMAKLTFFKTEN